METTRLDVPARPSAGLAPAAMAYLDALRAAHMCCLEAMGDACSSLASADGQADGQMANLAGIHQRLLRQFMDAQRSILQRRAEVDAEVAQIADAAAARAAALVGEVPAVVVHGGRTSPRSSIGQRPPALDVRTPQPALAGPFRLNSRDIAALGVSVVRTTDDIESLATVIDQAFETADLDGVAAQRRLTALLDEWWHDEVQEGRAVIDDAHARADVRYHLAVVEAGEHAAAPPPPGPTTATDAGAHEAGESHASNLPSPQPSRLPSPQPSRLPTDLMSVLDTGEHADLQQLLADLAVTLDLAAKPYPPAEPALDVVPVGRDATPIIDITGADGDDAFVRFWAKDLPDRAVVRRRRSRGVPPRLALPVAAAGSLAAVTAMLAWVV
ncbi:MAG: hypothetical protein Q7V88_06265 [Actinomycetota bacterium]|nr:hypothetical protein [Actinomycetota bacterium]